MMYPTPIPASFSPFKSDAKKKVKEKTFQILKSFPGVRNKPCLQISQYAFTAQSCDTEANQPFEEGDSHGKVCEPQSKPTFYIQE